MKRRSRPSKALMGRQLKEATERQEAAQNKAAAKFAAEAQRLQPLTWAEAQRIVEFFMDGKTRRYNIYEALPVTHIDSEKDKEQDGDGDGADADVVAATPGRPRKSAARKSLRPSQAANQQKQRIPVPVAKYEEITDFVKVAARKNVRQNAPYFKFNAQEFAANGVDKVEYDLDDQDAFWLKGLNERRRHERLPIVSESAFETIIDKFEKAAHFEAQNSGRLNDTGVDEDAVCCICLDGDCLNANAILFCDMCNLAVHQECYGVPYIPEGQWLCRRCLESPSLPVSCCLCPNKGGAFKRTDDGRWAHVVCALWIPEVSFSNSVFLEPIEGIKNIPNARWRLKCYLCKKSGVGAAIQCHRQHCYSAFHVTCAIQAGLFMRIDANPASEDRIKRTAFCDTHTPPNSDAVPMISHGTSDGERSSSNSPNAMGRLMKKRQKIRQARKLLAQHQIVNTQVVINVPTISDTSLQTISQQHHRLAGKSDLMRQILAYWQLKRKSRCGVPLIRRLHVSSSGSLFGSDALKENPGGEEGAAGGPGGLVSFAPNLAELVNSTDPYIREHVHQLRTFRLLRQNLERVRLLIELVHKRERMKRDKQRLTLASLEPQLTPFNMVLRSLLGKLRSLDRRDLFETPVSAKSAPTYYRVIKKPMCFSKMEDRLDSDGYSSIDDFERDFQLILDNCMSFNPKTTTFYKAAVELRNASTPVFTEARQYITSAEFDADTGMYMATLQAVPPAPPAKTVQVTTSPTTAALERRRAAANKQEVKTESVDTSKESPRSRQDSAERSQQSSESPPLRSRRHASKITSPNNVDDLLPQWARDEMPFDEQLAILNENLGVASRTGKTVVATQLRREIQLLKKKIHTSSGSERCSSVSTTASPGKEEKAVKEEAKVETGPVTRHRNSLSQASPAAVGSPRPKMTRRSHQLNKEKEPDSRTTSPISIRTGSPRSPTPANGLLMIASPAKSHATSPRTNSPRVPLVASTPMAASNGPANAPSTQPRIATRRSAAQAGIQLPSVFAVSPPPYKQSRRVSSATKQTPHNRTGSPSMHLSGLGIRVGTPSGPLNGNAMRSSPSLHRHSSLNGSLSCTNHNEMGDDSTPTSPPSTPGVNRRTAVLFQGKHRRPMPTSSSVASSPLHANHNGRLPNSTCSSPTRSNSVTSLMAANGHEKHLVNGKDGHHRPSGSPGGMLTDKNLHQNGGVNGLSDGQEPAGGKILRRMSSSSGESFRGPSPFCVAPLSDFAMQPVAKEKHSPSNPGGLTIPRRLSPRISACNEGSSSVVSSSPMELSDSDEELLAVLRRKRSSVNGLKVMAVASTTDSTYKSTSSHSMESRRSRRSSAASCVSSSSYKPRCFDVVWVRASAAASCPGVVVDAALLGGSNEDSSTAALSLLKRLLPSLPSSEVLAAKQSHDPTAWLVFHFDAKHSWRWVTCDRLEPLDASISVTDLHLPPTAQDSYRRACLIASKLASHGHSAVSSRSTSPA